MCFGSLRMSISSGHARLHPEGGLISADARGDLGVVDHVAFEPVQGADGVDDVALLALGHAPGPLT